MEHLLWIFILGGIVVLDTTAFAQTMINQPIVSCFILGCIFGDVKTGILLGLLIEYPWLRVVPAGGSIPNQGNFGSFITAGTALLILQIFPGRYYQILFFALSYGFLCSYLGARLTYYQRKLNFVLLKTAFNKAGSNKVWKIDFFHISGAVLSFFEGGLASVFFIWTGFVFLQYIFSTFSFPDYKAFQLAVLSLAGIGAGTLLSMVFDKNKIQYLAVGIISGLIVLFVLL